jgi:nucleoside-diphosphate-sugar epimerase
MTVLLTGASGFLGRRVYSLAQLRHVEMRCVFRSTASVYSATNAVLVPGLDDVTNWMAALQGIDAVIHTAARVHVMSDDSQNPLLAYRSVNVLGTLNLARQAAEAGVRRFIFISSIKVNGESTALDQPFTTDQIPAPNDPYGVSKYEAEIGLKVIAEETGMEVVIIRSPLVYGPGVKANFLWIMNWLRRGIPLPFGGITKNRRSFIFLDNLVDMIITCITHPEAANQTFMVSDNEDLSTAELLNRMALALGRPPKLIRVPVALITLGAKLLGRADIAQRVCGSLQIDIKKTKDLLSWSPPVSVDEGLRQTATHFLKKEP